MNKACRYLCLMVMFMATTLMGETVVRATVDIGSGATKLRVAEIDLQKQKISKVLATKTFAVPYQEQLATSNSNEFNADVMQTGLEALKQSAEIAKQHGATQTIATATAAFRKARNAESFMERIYRETGIRVFIIDQNLEGELAFKAATAQLEIPPRQLVVWDIGGGSVQLTAIDRLGQYRIFRGSDASVPFKNHIITWIQKRNAAEGATPNPLNFVDTLRAESHARAVANKVDNFFKRKIQEPQTKIVGVGNIFGLQLYDMVGKKNTLSREELIELLAGLVDKKDEDVGGGPFANVYVSNTILVLGFMEQLGIEEMAIADINPSDGAFFWPAFWEESEISVDSQCPNGQK